MDSVVDVKKIYNEVIILDKVQAKEYINSLSKVELKELKYYLYSHERFSEKHRQLLLDIQIRETELRDKLEKDLQSSPEEYAPIRRKK